MRFLNIRNLFFLIGTLVIVTACVKEKIDEFDLPEYEPSYAIHPIHSSITIREIVDRRAQGIEDIDLDTTADGLYILRYQDTVFTLSAQELFSIQNQSISEQYDLPGTGTTPPAPAGTTYVFDLGNSSKLSLIKLKSGSIDLQGSNSIGQEMEIIITVSSLTNSSGQTLVISKTVPAGGSLDTSINLSNYDLSLNAGVMNYSTEIRVSVPAGGTINLSNDVEFSLGLNDLQYSLIEGIIAPFPIPNVEGNVQLEIFTGTIDGDITFNAPKLSLIFWNSFGTPATADKITLNSTSADGIVTDFQSTDLNQIVVPRPLSPDAVIGIGIDSIVLDTMNSNIRDVIQSTPEKLTYNYLIGIGDTVNPSFIKDTSRVTVIGDIEIPMDAVIRAYNLADTLELTEELPDNEFVRSLEIKLGVNNQIPIAIFYQIYAVDSNYNKLDSLLIGDNQLIQPGIVDPNTGEVPESVYEESIIDFDEKRYENIENTKYFILEGSAQSFNFANDQSVKFFTYYNLDIDLAMIARLKVDLDSLGN